MSRFRNLFFGKTATNNNVKGQSYDTAIALDPPVKGSYPVAGNGPNVLEELQRTRAKRASRAASVTGSIAPAPAPTISRHRDSTIQRPRTAPHNGEPGGGQQYAATKSKNGRTLSGFSMKSPPNFFSSSRRSSVSSTRRRNSVRAESPPPLPSSVIPIVPSAATSHIPTYKPTGSAAPSIRNGFAPPSAPFAKQHSRVTSTASHKSHIDLLDAYSNINFTKEASKHRTKASGVRNYGEDVADRNIADFGDKRNDRVRDSRLDLNSPEFSYLKQVYSPKKRHPTRGPRTSHSRVDSALGHVLGSDGSSDDTQPQTQSYPRTSSIRSFTGPRPGSVYPPRTDSAKPYHSSRNVVRSDDVNSIRSNGTKDRRERAMSPLSATSVSIDEEPRVRSPPLNTTRTPSAPPIPERGRARALSTNSSKTPPPVSLPPNPFPAVRVTSPNNSRGSSSRTRSRAKRTLSSASDHSITRSSSNARSSSNTRSSSNNGGIRSSKGSISYSAFPSSTKRESMASESNTSPIRSPIIKDAPKRQTMIVEGAAEPPSLEGVVDLKDSVDTEVFHKTLPAVVHERITPTQHEIREQHITREIHTHEVHHRILPVIETEVLPTKHYIMSKDNKSLIEIPESELAQHAITGTYPRRWHVVPSSSPAPQPPTVDEASDSAPEGPVIGLARGEPHAKSSSTRQRGSSILSTKSARSAKDILQPILSSKKESVTKEGHQKTEYVWRHPPVYENANGETRPANLSSAFEGERFYSEDEDVEGKEFGAERGEGEFLFRDSGYGSGGMLPGLLQQNPVAMTAPWNAVGKVVGDDKESKGGEKEGEGEATRYLKRMKERRRSSIAEKGKGVEVLERGVRNLSMG